MVGATSRSGDGVPLLLFQPVEDEEAREGWAERRVVSGLVPAMIRLRSAKYRSLSRKRQATEAFAQASHFSLGLC